MTPDRRDLSLKRTVDAIRPRPSRYFVWDEKRTGLGLDVWPSGRRSWVYQYRNADGKQRRMKLGDANNVTPEQAGKTYLAALATVTAEADPLAARQARRAVLPAPQAGTLAEAGARYVTHLREVSKSDRWPDEVERILEKNIGELGALELTQLATDDMKRLWAAMKDRPIAYNRTRSAVSGVIAHAVTTGHWPRSMPNPVADAPEHDERARERYLRHDEWPRVAVALAAMADELTSAPARDTRRAQLAALITLALTGARVGAVLPRRWADVDVAERVLRVDPEHKGVTEIPLGLHALAHLETWRAVTGADTLRSAHRGAVFPGQSRPSRRTPSIASVVVLWRDLRTRAQLEGFTLHDWRRTFATVAGDVGITDHMIGGLLCHTVPGIRGRYARRTPAALLDAADAVSAEIAKRLGLTFPCVLPAPIRNTEATP